MSDKNNTLRYIYDLETENHHFAAGVGDIIVHNSVYGALGARTGFIPLMEGAASVTAMGRKLILSAIDRIKKEWKHCKLVYGDTDSCMLIFKGETLEKTVDLSEEASELATHFLKCEIIGISEGYCVTKYLEKMGKDIQIPIRKVATDPKNYPYPLDGFSKEHKIKIIEYRECPIDLEFENLYREYLLLTKKRYKTLVANKLGEVVGKINKGTVDVRRNNCEFLRKVYGEIGDLILEHKTKDDILDVIYNFVTKLFTGQVPVSELIINFGVKDLISYAKKETVKGKEIFVDINGYPIREPTGPLDPRLVYSNIPQVLLLLKMAKRGDILPPNSKLELMYIEVEESLHQGEGAEDYTYFLENKEMLNLKPDYFYYIEKQLQKPINEVLNVRFPSKEKIVYEKIEDSVARIFESLTTKISKIKRQRILNYPKQIVKNYKDGTYKKFQTPFQKSIKRKNPYPHVIGWECLEKMGVILHKDEKKSVNGMDYNLRGVNGIRAKIGSLLMSYYSGGKNDFNKNKSRDETELIEICEKWYARDILNRLYKQNGLPKRPHRMAKQRGIKILVGTKILIFKSFCINPKTKDEKKIKRNQHGTLIERFDPPKETPTKLIPEKTKYTLLLDDGTKIEKCSRNVFRTYYMRDNDIIGDILTARKHYCGVVKQLDKLFEPEFIIE